jgi:hypothetical protein
LSRDETEAKVRQMQAPVRTDKHLARSLEDVSHLFLSKENARNGSPEKPAGDSTERDSPHPGERPVFLREEPPQTPQKDSLVSLLNSQTGILEDGLKAIDTNVPVDFAGPVDLVAVDRFDKLCLIDIDLSGNDDLLLRGIYHFDWFVRNVPIVRRMYHGRVIDFSAHPRIFLVAPKFSAMFRCAAKRIACTQIYCYLYQVTAGSGGTGILLTRV